MLSLESGNKAALVEREKLVRRLQEKPRAEEAEEAHRPPKEFENQLRGALKTSDLETLKRDFNTMKEMTTKATKKIEDKKKEKKVKVVGKGDGNLVEAIQKPTHLRSQKPMTRVEVVDVASEKDVGKVMKTIKPKPEVKIVETKTEQPKVELKKEGSQSKGFCKKMEKEISSDLSKVHLHLHLHLHQTCTKPAGGAGGGGAGCGLHLQQVPAGLAAPAHRGQPVQVPQAVQGQGLQGRLQVQHRRTGLMVW